MVDSEGISIGVASPKIEFVSQWVSVGSDQTFGDGNTKSVSDYMCMTVLSKYGSIRHAQK